MNNDKDVLEEMKKDENGKDGITVGVDMNSQSEMTDKVVKKKKHKIIIPIVVVLAIIIGLILFLTNSSTRRKIAMKRGEHYLAELEYAEAVAQYQVALDIDEKRGDESDDVNEKLEYIISVAEERMTEELYSDAVEILTPITMVTSSDEDVEETVLYATELKSKSEIYVRAYELLKLADEAFEAGEYEKAVELYDQVAELLNDDTLIQPRRSLAWLYKKLIELWLAKDYDQMFKYLDSNEFKPVVDYMDKANPQHVICMDQDYDLYIVLSDGTLYVRDGDFSGNETMTGTAVISCVNCYAVYSGDWKNNIPCGNGTVTIGKKRNRGVGYSVNDVEYSGAFADGIADGGMKYTDDNIKDIPFTVAESNLEVFKIDEKNRIWVTDMIGEYYYVAGEEKSKVDNYIFGVPGFGGTEDLFVINQRQFDDEPPVITYDTFVGDTGFDYKNDVQAEDAIDGIINVKCDRNYDKDRKKITYSFSATDREGNSAYLTIVENVTIEWVEINDAWGCGAEPRERYRVESIKEGE